jgi:hypothetical protein
MGQQLQFRPAAEFRHSRSRGTLFKLLTGQPMDLAGASFPDLRRAALAVWVPRKSVFRPS